MTLPRAYATTPQMQATARRALENGGSDRPESFYATHLQAAFASPFVSLVMLLLSAPVALANFRSGQGAVLLQHGVRSNRLQMLARARWLQREEDWESAGSSRLRREPAPASGGSEPIAGGGPPSG